MPYDYPFWIELLIVLGASALFMIGMSITEKLLTKMAAKKWEPFEVTKHVQIYLSLFVVGLGFFWAVVFSLTFAKDIIVAIVLGLIAAAAMLIFRKKQLRLEFFKTLAKSNPYLAAKCLQ